MTPAEGQTTTPGGADVDPLTVLDARIIDRRFALSAAIGAHGMAVAAEELRKAIEARTAVAALIARNAELEGALKDRDAVIECKNIDIRERDNSIKGWAERARKAEAERDALAAENKELRRQLAPIDKAVAQWVAEGSVYWNLPMIPKDVRDALARTPATGADA